MRRLKTSYQTLKKVKLKYEVISLFSNKDVQKIKKYLIKYVN